MIKAIPNRTVGQDLHPRPQVTLLHRHIVGQGMRTKSEVRAARLEMNAQAARFQWRIEEKYSCLRLPSLCHNAEGSSSPLQESADYNLEHCEDGGV